MLFDTLFLLLYVFWQKKVATDVPLAGVVNTDLVKLKDYKCYGRYIYYNDTG